MGRFFWGRPFSSTLNLVAEYGAMAGLYLGKRNGKEVYYDGGTHLMTVGPPGCGKSQNTIATTMLSADNRSFVVIDSKAELRDLTIGHRSNLGEVIEINPFGDHSDGFNPLAGLDPKSRNFPDECSRIAEAIVVMEQGKGAHFTGSARSIIAATIMRVKMLHEDKAAFYHVRKLLGQPREQLIESIVDMVAEEFPPMSNKVSRLLNTTNEAQDVVATVSQQLESFDSIPISEDMQKGRFDFKTLRDGVKTVYIILPPSELATHQTWMRMLLSHALYSLMAAPENNRPPVVFVMDEYFASVGRLQVVERLMVMTRAYGIQLWPILQSLLQAQDLFGKNWETFVSCSGVLQAYPPADMFTAEYLSRRSGPKTIYVPNPTASGMSGSYTGVPFMLPQDFMNMGHANTAIFTNRMSHPARVGTAHYSQTRWASRAGKSRFDVRQH